MGKKEKLKKETKQIVSSKKQQTGTTELDESTNMPMGMKVVIGVLSLVCIVLIGFIVYRQGEKSVAGGNSEDLSAEESLMSDNGASREINLSDDSTVLESNNNSDDINISSDLSGELSNANSIVGNSSMEARKKDLDKLAEEIDNLSDADDEFQDVKDEFDKGI